MECVKAAVADNLQLYHMVTGKLNDRTLTDEEFLHYNRFLGNERATKLLDQAKEMDEVSSDLSRIENEKDDLENQVNDAYNKMEMAVNILEDALGSGEYGEVSRAVEILKLWMND